MPARAWGAILLQDVLGAVWKPLGDTKNLGAGVLGSAADGGGVGLFS